ncbi:type VI secretion system protein [Radicibacter daui]|uniref:type VI secretion system protein n=1 Tax=Radicibacter daui TaxID=3064829 RepID=UPI0040469FA1
MMEALFTWLAGDQYIVLAIIGVLMLLLVLVMVVVLVRANKAARALPEDAPPPPVELDVISVTPEDIAAQKQQEVRSLRRLMRDGFSATKESFARNPYLMPWVLRVGVGSNGDGGLLAASEQIRPPLGDPGRDALSWHFYERGVILNAGRSDLWSQILSFVSRKRPSLPLDGILLTVSVADLADSRRANALGSEAYALLWQAQRTLGFAVPVYVVVTGTENLPGFEALEGMLPPGFRDGMLGWSFPYPMDTAFSGDYVGEALSAIEQGVLSITFEAFGSVMEGARGAELLRIRENLTDLEEPLKAFLTTAFRRTAFHEANFFRGVYFIAQPDPDRGASFAHDLIEQKVFAESGLSRPLRGARGRVWRRFAWPAVALVLLMAGAASIAASLGRLHAYQAAAVPALHALASDVSAFGGLRTKPVDAAASSDAAIRYLNTANVLARAEPFLYLPASWVERDPYGARAAMRAGWENVVMVALKAHIEDKLRDLSNSGETDLPPDIALPRFLSRLAEAEGFALAYNQLSAGTPPASTRELIDYALNVNVPAQTMGHLVRWDVIGPGSAPYSNPNLHIDLTQFQPAAQATYLQFADGYMRMLAAGGQAGLRLQLVSKELKLLVTGRKAGKSATASFMEVSAGLDEARSLLASGQPSWLGAAGPVVPADIQLMMDAAAKSDLLGPRSARDVQALASRRFEEVKGQVLAVDSPIGPLVTRTEGVSAALSSPAESLRQTLAQWLQRSFMQPADTTTASAAPLSGYGWDSASLESVPPLFDDYMLFEAKEMAQLPPSLRPAMRSAAQESLHSSVTLAIDRASTGIDARAVAATNSLAQLGGYASSLRVAVPVIEQTIQSYLQIGMSQPADEVRNRVSSLAGAIVERVDQMLADDQLYRPSTRYLANWQGEAISPAGMFDQPDLPALRQRLIQWRLEITTLARDTAGPMLEVLSRPLLQTPRATAVAAKWLQISAALDAYDGARPNASLLQLENFISTDMAAISAENCAGDPTAPGMGGDFFADALESLKRDIRGRCYQLKDERLVTAYQSIKQIFDQRLAGHIPFTYAGGNAAPAGREDVAAFYAAFDASKDVLTTAIPAAALTRQAWQPPAAFISAMATARPFLMQVAAPEAGTSLMVNPSFRANRAGEVGGSDIIEWSFGAGSKQVSSFTGGDVAWAPGETASISLRWARNGPVVPVRVLGSTLGTIDGLTARYSADGLWSLYSLMRGLTAPPGDAADAQAVSSGTLLRFDVAIGSADAPSVDGTATASLPARVYARLELSRSKTEQGQTTKEKIAFPGLPAFAPELPVASSHMGVSQGLGQGLGMSLPQLPGMVAPGAAMPVPLLQQGTSYTPSQLDREMLGLSLPRFTPATLTANTPGDL